jgi:cytochrome oxidase Cu insertion factor (SCO1/SenC/PrrC family)
MSAEECANMVNVVSRTLGVVLLATVLGMTLIAVGPGPARAVEVGEPAPDFTLPSTTGADISLSDFRGKKWVLLEFYGADFAPV